MKNPLNSIFGLLILTVTLTVLIPLSAYAQTPEDLRMRQVMSPNGNIEDFRQEMKNYFTDLENALTHFESFPAVREQYEKSGVNPSFAVRKAKVNLDSMLPEELVKMRATYAKFPGWREGPRVIYNISQRLTQKNIDKKTGDTTANVITPDTCPDISAVPSYTDIAITKAFEIAADAVMEALPTDFLSILAREVSVAARAGLKGGILAEETLRGQYEFCISPTTEDVQNIVTEAKDEILANDNANTTTITTSVSNAQTAIINNDNTNKDTIVTNDNNNKTMIVNNDNANTLALTNLINATRVEILNTVKDSKEETNNLLLRTQIEADLSSTDGSTFVALYETPSNVCLPSLNQKGLPQIGALSNPVQCGLLDLVRSIVRDTIANVNNSTNASAFFAEGDAQRTLGNYKAAYTAYRKAYKAASK